MKTKRKSSVCVLLTCMLFSVLLLQMANAAGFPEKPVKAIVAFSAGGGNDRAMRLIQPYLEKELGQPLVVENRGGAGTEIANTLLYRAPADGYTFMSTNWAYLVLTTILRKPVYKYEDFAAVVVELVDPRIVLVKKDSPYNNLKDVIEDTKKKPGKIAFGCSAGGNQQLLLFGLRDLLKLDFKVVGYKGGSPARAAMLGGHVDAAMGETGGAYYLRDQTKALCVFHDKVSPMWPEAKPANEQLKPYGVKIPDLARYSLYMVRSEAKKKYPDRFAKLVDAFLKASKNPEYVAKAEKAGIRKTQVWAPGEKFQAVFKEQVDFFRKTKSLWKEKQ